MNAKIRIGLDRFPDVLKKLPLGDSPVLLCNESSCTSNLINAVDFLLANEVPLKALFGPQHGIRITDQANMIEWEGFKDSSTGLPVYSLYGQNRSPSDESLAGISSFIIDLQDVGSRYYTYIWTALFALRKCAQHQIPCIILDRPNPLGGIFVEGPAISKGFESFVGLSSIPIRHGCTFAELMNLFAKRENLVDYLHVVPLEGWSRDMFFQDTGLHWCAPSPNIPCFDTTLTYPGACLLEATNISEGRGTTLPFKVLGAPWLNSKRLCNELDSLEIHGAFFRQISFKPLWDKYAGEICNGIQIHVANIREFEPIKCYYQIIRLIKKIHPSHFKWAPPPYEYEYELMPIDILTGSSEFRDCIENENLLMDIFTKWHIYYDIYQEERNNSLLY